MKKNLYNIFILLIIILFASSYAFAVSRGIRMVSKKGENIYLYNDYQALVIGITDYDHWPKLPNATKDAKEVSAKLKEMGFEVKMLLDPTYREMKNAFGEAIYKMGKEENRAILFYYAGHGETEILVDKSHMGYIIPKDCPLLEKDPMSFTSKAISMREIESVSMRIKSKHVLMLFDSCFSGSLFNLVRATPKNISEKSIQPVRQYITAGKHDEVVPDKSMFKRCLLKGLDGDADLTGDGYITGSELGMYLNENVINYTRSSQHPQYGKINNPDLDKGDFIFVPKKIQEKALKKEDEAERQRIDADKEFLEEKRRLEAERLVFEKEKKKLEIGKKEFEEKQKLAYIQKSVKGEKINLRKEPKLIQITDIKEFLAKYQFFESSLNMHGNFTNNIVDNGDGTVMDSVTGLMWQKRGSPKRLENHKAKLFVKKLNKEKYASFSDWRLPTLEELASLSNRIKTNGLYIDPVFDSKQVNCWTADYYIHSSQQWDGAWIVNFRAGNIAKDYWSKPGDIKYYRSNPNFVRAVRTIE